MIRPLGRGDRHLGGGVEGQFRGDPPCEPSQPDVLHEHRIDPRAVEQAQIVDGLLEFAGKDEGIKGDVSFDAVPVAKGDQRREIRLGEVVRAHPGVKPGQAEVDRIRAVGNRRAHAIPVARRGEKFR